MKDVLDQQLEVDDVVVVIPMSGTLSLSVGVVRGFTSDKVKLKIIKSSVVGAPGARLVRPECMCKVARDLVIPE